MIRPLRRLHGALLPVLAALVAILLARAVVRRPAAPVNTEWPAALDPARPTKTVSP